MEVDKDTSYLIGIFQSDGTMNKGKGNKGKAQLEISTKDEDIIYKIKDIITYNYSIKKRIRNITMKGINYIHESIHINIYDIEFRNFLETNGVPYGKKSKIIDVPKSMNLSKVDYIRGLFDGDGSLGFTKNGFPFISFVTQSEKIKNFLLDFFAEITDKKIKQSNRNKRDNLYNISLYKEDAILFCEKVYYDNCLSLNRKYKISKDITKWNRPENMKKIDFIRKKWTTDEDIFILNHNIEESVKKLNRTKKSIKIRLIRLKNNFTY